MLVSKTKPWDDEPLACSENSSGFTYSNLQDDLWTLVSSDDFLVTTVSRCVQWHRNLKHSVCVYTLTQTAARDPDSVTVSSIQCRDPHLFGGLWDFNTTVKILCCLCVCGWVGGWISYMCRCMCIYRCVWVCVCACVHVNAEVRDQRSGMSTGNNIPYQPTTLVSGDLDPWLANVLQGCIIPSTRVAGFWFIFMYNWEYTLGLRSLCLHNHWVFFPIVEHF